MWRWSTTAELRILGVLLGAERSLETARRWWATEGRRAAKLATAAWSLGRRQPAVRQETRRCLLAKDITPGASVHFARRRPLECEVIGAMKLQGLALYRIGRHKLISFGNGRRVRQVYRRCRLLVLSRTLRRGLSTGLELISADLFCLLLNLGRLPLALLLNLVDFLLGEPLLLSLDPPFKLLVLLFLLELCRFLARLCLLHLLLDLLLVLQSGLLFGRIDFLVLFSDICADSDGRRLTPRIIASTLHLLRGRRHTTSVEVPTSTHASHILLL